jgi:hypothetical protein
MRIILALPNLLTLIVILWTSNCPVHAQNLDVSISKPDILSSLTENYRIFGHDSSGYYVIKYEGSQYTLQKLDKDLNVLLEEPVKRCKGLVNYAVEGTFLFHDELLIFLSQSKLGEEVLYYQKLDNNTLKPLDDLKEITTVKNLKGNYAEFHIVLSRAENKLLVVCTLKLTLSHSLFNEYYVFDKGMEVVWKKKDSFEFKGQGPRSNQYLVDEKGNVSILGLLRRESIFTAMSDVKNMYAVYRYTNDGMTFKEYPLVLPDRYIKGVKIVATLEGDLICGGLFSEILKAGVRGTFFLKIDGETGQPTNYYLNSFDQSVMAELAGLKDPIINDTELMDYVISDMVLRDNGRIVFIAEQIFPQTYDTYNNLIVICYDQSGQVSWTRVIAKKQNFNYLIPKSRGIELTDYRNMVREFGYLNMGISNYCSYALMAPLNRNQVVLVYNDDIRNMNNPKTLKSFGTPKKSYLLAITLDENGNMTKHPLTAWKRKCYFPEPMRYYDTLGDTIVIPAFRYRGVDYYKIDVNF